MILLCFVRVQPQYFRDAPLSRYVEGSVEPRGLKVRTAMVCGVV